MTNAEEILRGLVKGNQVMDAIHTYDPLPLTFGSIKQQGELLDIVGKWNEYQNGNIPGMVYDGMLAYYNSGRPGLTIQGIETEDRTPVGMVAHPAPLDITSWLYWSPLVAQGIELTYNAVKPAEVSDSFMNEISIAGAMTKADLIEKYENSPLAEHLFSKPQKFKIDYYHTRDGEKPEHIGYMEANQPCPISEWPEGFFNYEHDIGCNRSGALVRKTEYDFDPTITKKEDE